MVGNLPANGPVVGGPVVGNLPANGSVVGGPVVGNLPANAGEVVSISHPERSPMLQGNEAYVAQLLKPTRLEPTLR